MKPFFFFFTGHQTYIKSKGTVQVELKYVIRSTKDETASRCNGQLIYPILFNHFDDSNDHTKY